MQNTTTPHAHFTKYAIQRNWNSSMGRFEHIATHCIPVLLLHTWYILRTDISIRFRCACTAIVVDIPMHFFQWFHVHCMDSKKKYKRIEKIALVIYTHTSNKRGPHINLRVQSIWINIHPFLAKLVRPPSKFVSGSEMRMFNKRKHCTYSEMIPQIINVCQAWVFFPKRIHLN